MQEESLENLQLYQMKENLMAPKKVIFLPSKDLIMNMIQVVIKHNGRPEQDIFDLFAF